MRPAPVADRHPFLTAPHRTIVGLGLPVLLSLVAEPLTGLVDTGFVAQLGVGPLAALGVGTAALSSVFWVFNFLGIGTQTEVARADGRGAAADAARLTTLALLLAGAFGVLLVVVLWPLLTPLARLLGAVDEVLPAAVTYMRVRLFGAPALLLTMTAFGALRGLQEMRIPLWIALAVNGLNIVLDALLVFGFGRIPALGIAGAAWASVIAQNLGALWAVAAVVRRLGWSRTLPSRHDVGRLLRVGGDLFVRTGMLTLFLLLTTRLANQAGPASGAAHQAIRQVWLFTALGMDALALSAQSLVGYFLGAGQLAVARRVARLCALWGVALGAVLGGLMLALQPQVIRWLVPDAAAALFRPAWLVSAVVQPLNAVAFVTDGVHWGSGDFRFLRNGMLGASGLGALLLLAGAGVGGAAAGLTAVWAVTGVWIALRAALGVARVWPGIGRSPFRPTAAVA